MTAKGNVCLVVAEVVQSLGVVGRRHILSVIWCAVAKVAASRGPETYSLDDREPGLHCTLVSPSPMAPARPLLLHTNPFPSISSRQKLHQPTL